MITKEEILIRNILGPSTSNIRPLAAAVRIIKELLFVKRIPQDEILMTSDVYSPVAFELQRMPKTTARQIERAANLCWNAMTDEQKRTYIGRELADIDAPRDILFYLAYYSQFEKPYYVLMKEQNTFLTELNRL